MPVLTELAPRPVFLINGMHKTGTTWLQRILDAHLDMQCRAEDQFVKISDPLMKLFHDYNQIIYVADAERDAQGTTAFDREDAYSTYFFMVRLALAKAPPSLGWSGIKDNLINPDSFLQFIPNARVVHILRDPRDLVVSSWASDRRLTGEAGNEWTHPHDEHIADVFRLWSKFASAVLARVKSDKDRVRFVRYEDLYQDFYATVSALYAFFGVDNDAQTVADVRTETDFSRLSKGRKPGEEDPNSFFRKGIAGDWVNALDPASIAGHVDEHGDLMRNCGYLK